MIYILVLLGFTYSFFTYNPFHASIFSTNWVKSPENSIQIIFNNIADILLTFFGSANYLLAIHLFIACFRGINYTFFLPLFAQILFLMPKSGYIGDLLKSFHFPTTPFLHAPVLLFFLIKTYKINFKPKAKPKSKPKPQPIKLQQTKGLPPISILTPPLKSKAADWNFIEQQKQLEQVLQEFGVKGKIIKSSVGPVVTLYELLPDPGVKAQRIINLSNDIARSMSALSVRISTIAGKDVIGIELSNPKREIVYFSQVLSSSPSYGLDLALGCDISGKPVSAQLEQMPHMLMAGTTGSGKSVVIHTLLLSILFKHTPSSCRLMLIDPKMLELSSYADIPHLITPVVTDPKLASIALKWIVQEMERRYKLMASIGVRNLEAYNKKSTSTLPFIVVVVDEFADLMLVAGKEIDSSIQRLAQMARAAGIHVILATQRPSVDVITGTIKANFPTRIALQVASKIDARTILGDYGGAEQLLGKGDMLYLQSGKLVRIHGPYVSPEEVEGVVEFWKKQQKPEYESIMLGEDESYEGADGFTEQVWEFLKSSKRISTSSVQREFGVGFNKAAKVMENLEKIGRITPPDNMGRRKLKM